VHVAGCRPSLSQKNKASKWRVYAACKCPAAVHGSNGCVHSEVVLANLYLMCFTFRECGRDVWVMSSGIPCFLSSFVESTTSNPLRGSLSLTMSPWAVRYDSVYVWFSFHEVSSLCGDLTYNRYQTTCLRSRLGRSRRASDAAKKASPLTWSVKIFVQFRKKTRVGVPSIVRKAELLS